MKSMGTKFNLARPAAPLALLGMLGVALASGSIAWAEGAKTPTPEEMAKAMERMQQIGGPGPEHALLAQMSGTWTQSIKMNFPGAPTAAVQGRSTHTMILGGRFLEVRGEAEMFGQKLETLSILGFDRRNSRYTIVGFDTAGTYSVAGEGTYDAATKTLTLSGETHDSVIDHTERYDFRYRFPSEDEIAIEILFQQPDGSKFTGVEVTLRKVKS